VKIHYRIKEWLLLSSLCVSAILISTPTEWEPVLIDSAQKAREEKSRLDSEKKQEEERIRTLHNQESAEYQEAYRALVEIEIDRETVEIAEKHFTNLSNIALEKEYSQRTQEIEKARSTPANKEAFFAKEAERIRQDVDAILNPASNTIDSTDVTTALTFTDKLKLRTRAFLAERLADLYSVIGNRNKMAEVATKLQAIYNSLNDAANQSRTLRLEGIASSRLGYSIQKHAQALDILKEAFKAKRSMRVLDELSITLIDLIRLRSLIPTTDEAGYQRRAQIDQLINQLYADLKITPEFKVYIEKQAGTPNVSFIGIRTGSSNKDIAHLYDQYRFKQLADIKKNVKNTAALKKGIENLLDSTQSIQQFFESPTRQTISPTGKIAVYEGLKWTYIEVGDLAAAKIVELAKLPKRSAQENTALSYFIKTFYEAEQTRYLIQTKITELAQATQLPASVSVQATERYKQYRAQADKAIKLTPQHIEILSQVMSKNSTAVTTPLTAHNATATEQAFTTLKSQMESIQNLLSRLQAVDNNTLALENQFIQNIGEVIDRISLELQRSTLTQNDLQRLTRILQEAVTLQKNVAAIQAFHLNQSTPVFTASDGSKQLVHEDTNPVEHTYAAALVTPLQSAEAETLQESARSAAVLTSQAAPDAFVPPAPPPPSLTSIVSLAPAEQKIITDLEQLSPAKPSIDKSLSAQINQVQLKKTGERTVTQQTDSNELSSILARAINNRRTAFDPDQEVESTSDDEWDETGTEE
jgi:hypothetical protein